MRIKLDKPFQVSLDDGLTVETFLPGSHDVKEWVGKLAIKYHGAKEVKRRIPTKKAE